MFRRLPNTKAETITVQLNGRPVMARTGDSVAAALLSSGADSFRLSAVSSRPRGPYCLMGVCFDCLVAIDGVHNRQACLIAVAEGMRIETNANPGETT